MKNFKTITLLLLLSFTTLLIGSSTYINVANVKTKKELHYPYKKLKAMGLKMFYKQKSFGYSAYIGPFKSKNSTLSTLQRVKKTFPRAKIVTKTEQKTKKVSQKNISSRHDGFIAGIGIGYAKAISQHTITQGSLTITEPKSQGMNYSLYGGYDFEMPLSLLLSYDYLDTGDLAFHNIYSTLNYKIEIFEDFTPFVGMSLGYSSLKWSTTPIVQSSSSSSNDSADLLYGADLGFLYKFSQTLSFKVNYNYFFLKHATNITKDATNISKLEHNVLHSLSTTLQYNF